MRNAVMRLAVLCGALGALSTSWAVPIVGSSNGFFTGLSSCDDSGWAKNCRIVSTANGLATQVQWAKDVQDSGTTPSTLTAVDVGINATTDANDVVIARLDWYNSSTKATSDLDYFGVNWNLLIIFTQPNLAGDFEQFNLSIHNPVGAPDQVSGLTLADLSNLDFNLNGVTVSDLKYSVLGSSFSGNTWTNAENNWASLSITADFRNKVPEPGTLLLLGAVLGGFALTRRRSR